MSKIHDHAQAIRFMFYLIALAGIFAFIISGCATNKLVIESCEINTTDNRCWIDKSMGTGHSFSEMNGYFALPGQQMESVLTRLQECKTLP